MPAKEFFMKTISCGCLPQSVHPVFFVQKYFLCMTRISLLLPVNMFPNLLTKGFKIKLSGIFPLLTRQDHVFTSRLLKCRLYLYADKQCWSNCLKKVISN